MGRARTLLALAILAGMSLWHALLAPLRDPLDAPDPGGRGEDESLGTLDVMLPGGIPEAFLRLRDPRGLADAYESWVEPGRIRRSSG